MNVIWSVLAAFAFFFVAAFVAGFVSTPDDPVRSLERQVISLMRVNKSRGRDELMERVENLRERFPGKSYRWYLEWLLTDLERAKR